MAVVIVTANRYRAVDSWLYTSADGFYRMGVDIIVYDSSSDDKTEAVTRNFQIDGFDNVKYERWTGEWDGFSLDQKVIDAYKIFMDEYDYLWMMRDGLIIMPGCIEEIEKHLISEPDVLVVNDKWRSFKEKGSKEYTNPVEMFSELCMEMTVLGVNIVKCKFIRNVLEEIPLERGKTYSLYQPIAFFRYFGNHPDINAKSAVMENLFSYNASASAKSFWSKKTFEQWGNHWYNLICNLPSCYNRYKKDVLRIELWDFRPFSQERLMGLRSESAFSYSIYKEYKDILPKVCDTDIKLVFLIAILPSMIARYILRYPAGVIGQIWGVICCIYSGIPDERKISSEWI